jgi:phosphatidylinositol alpha-1,6-mannosyltransferase
LGGIKDAVVEGKSGILIEAGKWDQLSDAVLTLLADESLRQEMGQFGRERAKTELDWPVVARRYLTYLEALLQEKH